MGNAAARTPPARALTKACRLPAAKLAFLLLAALVLYLGGRRWRRGGRGRENRGTEWLRRQGEFDDLGAVAGDLIATEGFCPIERLVGHGDEFVRRCLVGV